MTLNLPAPAVATALPIAMSTGGTAFAQKQGGILRMSHFDSVASISMHEEATGAVNRPIIGVFNNLVMYRQDVAQNGMGSKQPLLRRWARAQVGDGQVVLISGEPGIGKSRIVAAPAERLHPEPHIRLRYFCSPYLDRALQPKDDPFGPVERAHGCRGWLKSLGLGQYEALFRANEIETEILPELTEVDLEKLGVPLGHRKASPQSHLRFDRRRDIGPALCIDRFAAARHRRAAAADGDVLRSRRLDGVVGALRPRGIARGDPCLSEHCFRRRRAL